MKGRKMSFQRIFLPVIFLPGFQSDRSEAFFNLIVQVEIIGETPLDGWRFILTSIFRASFLQWFKTGATMRAGEFMPVRFE